MNNLSKYFFLLGFIVISSGLFGQKTIKGNFEHVVLMWLKNPDSQADKNQLEKGMRELIKSSQYIVSAHLGEPAMTDREIVDNTYTFNYTVTFKSKEDQEAYQIEPVHKKFVEECQHLWSKVLIYDSINILD